LLPEVVGGEHWGKSKVPPATHKAKSEEDFRE
jgi:hypothetical protein